MRLCKNSVLFFVGEIVNAITSIIFTLLRTVAPSLGAGTILKFVLSTKIGNKEAIDFVPDPLKPIVSHAVSVIVYLGYGLLTGSYSGPNADTAMQTDLVAALGTSAAATVVHNIFSEITAWIASRKQVALPPAPPAPSDPMGVPGEAPAVSVVVTSSTIAPA